MVKRRRNPKRKKEQKEKEQERIINEKEKEKEEYEKIEDIILSSEELFVVLQWYWFKATDNDGYFSEMVKEKDKRVYNHLLMKYKHLLPVGKEKYGKNIDKGV